MARSSTTFGPGNKGGGRKKLLPEDISYTEGCRKLLPLCLKTVEDLLRSAETPAPTKAKLVELVSERVLGKPAQQLAVTGEDGGPLIVKWQD